MADDEYGLASEQQRSPLDHYFGENADDPLTSIHGPVSTVHRRLGQVVGGSLKEGLTVKLAEDVSVEDVKVGQYVTIEGERQRFFAMIGDIELRVTDGQMESTPPDLSDPFVAAVLRGTSIYGALTVSPLLTIDKGALGQVEGPRPVKTLPAHFSTVWPASEEDVAAVFGGEDSHHYYIGKPLDMETRICLDLRRLAERSSGVFGKSGTGKTYLTRWLLIGLIQKEIAVNLVFDMHSEYGWAGTSEGEPREVKGLRQHFGSRVAVFTLDEESSRRRKVPVEQVVEIGYGSVEPEDVELLKETLLLTDKAAQSAYRLARHFGDRQWLGRFLEIESSGELDELAKELNEHEGSLATLRRRLERLRRLPFLKAQPRADSIAQILKHLESGRNVVIEFGRYQNLDAYILVANILTRRIHQTWVEKTESALGALRAEEPRPLVITIEEAHKFLGSDVARQTIFGTIAREMRKYNVTLLVVDQRPSGIDDEVMSQIGTRLTCLLDNERDVDAVLTGVSGRSELRSVLAKLESKQQALILGHAVPMPVVIEVRPYGPESYGEIGFATASAVNRRLLADQSDLFNP